MAQPGSEGVDGNQEQRKRFREAVERKSEAARKRSQASRRTPADGSTRDLPPVQEPLVEDGRPQDVSSPRTKNSGKGKKTADKWNQ